MLHITTSSINSNVCRTCVRNRKEVILLGILRWNVDQNIPKNIILFQVLVLHKLFEFEKPLSSWKIFSTWLRRKIKKWSIPYKLFVEAVRMTIWKGWRLVLMKFLSILKSSKIQRSLVLDTQLHLITEGKDDFDSTPSARLCGKKKVFTYMAMLNFTERRLRKYQANVPSTSPVESLSLISSKSCIYTISGFT